MTSHKFRQPFAHYYWLVIICKYDVIILIYNVTSVINLMKRRKNLKSYLLLIETSLGLIYKGITEDTLHEKLLVF